MQCPGCGAENPGNAAYCNLCLMRFGQEDIGQPGSAEPGKGYAGEIPPGTVQDVSYPSGTGGVLAPGEWHGTPLYSDGRPTVANHVASKFSWEKALWTCLKVSAMTAVISFLFEWVLGVIALGAVSAGHFTIAWLWILSALFIPVCVSAFIAGYQVGDFGWAVGGITVALTYLVFRVVYAMITTYVFSGGQFHLINPFTPVFLGAVLLIYCPVGMLFGHLGELRATTGLRF